MVFWIAILAGALFTWLAVRMGFYETWVLLFNAAVSIYLAIFLAPMVARSVPMPGGAAWCTALSMLVLAGGSFAILHGLSYVFLTGQFSIPFPNLLDVVFSGILGFAAGFLILSFAALTMATTPLVEHKMVNTLGLGRQGQQANIAGLAACCDLIHSVTGFEDSGTTRSAVARLFETTDHLSEADKAPPEPNEPNAVDVPPSQPPETEAGSTPSPLTGRSRPADAPDE
jgi:hypothetical protein